MTHMESIERQAEVIGTEHGRNAASWWMDGNVARFTVEATLRGIEECDPMVMDSMPSSPLSGEYADDFSIRDLCDELGLCYLDADAVDEACRAYEDAFYLSSVRAIEAACIDYLKGAGVEFEASL